MRAISRRLSDKFENRHHDGMSFAFSLQYSGVEQSPSLLSPASNLPFPDWTSINVETQWSSVGPKEGH